MIIEKMFKKSKIMVPFLIKVIAQSVQNSMTLLHKWKKEEREF